MSISHPPTLTTVLEAAGVPAAFRPRLEGALEPGETLERPVYSEAFQTGKFRFPASVVVLTADRWLLAWQEEDGGDITLEADRIEDLLSLELTIILLYGQLKVDSVKGGQYQASAVQFNTVAGHRYCKLIQQALTRLVGSVGQGSFKRENQEQLHEYPLKFRNVALLYLPPGERILQSLYWDAGFSGFRRELVPATELILSERYLVVIAEEKARGINWKKEPHFGQIIRYIPRRHVGEVDWEGGSRSGRVLVEVRNAHGRESLEIDAPLDKQEEITAWFGAERGVPAGAK